MWQVDPVPNYWPRLDTIFRRHIERLAELGVLFCIPTINSGYGKPLLIPIGDAYPQILGAPDNNIVTVGSVGRNGILQPWSSPEGSSHGGSPGSITVYAGGSNVETISKGGFPITFSGSSFAVPQVAGLIAYFLALPENADRFKWTGDGIDLVMQVKDYLVDRSYRRIRMKDQHYSLWVPFPLPTDVNVAYNDAWGPQVPCGSGDTNPQDPLGEEYQCPNPSTTPASSPTSSLSLDTTLSPTITTMAIPPPPPPVTQLLPSGATWNSSVPHLTTEMSATTYSESTWTGSVPLTSTDSTSTVIDTSTSTTTPSETPVNSPTTTASTLALSTLYYNASTAAGCTSDMCTECADGFHQSCVTVEDKNEVQCVCVWNSACVRDPRIRGECDQPCPDPGQVRDCETDFPEIDPTSYPNGYCQCVDNICKSDTDCTGTCGTQFIRMVCAIENGAGKCRCP
ncbi:hypothetical protein F4810DRAFT_182819 [Camillea tinctor]|nr:hypothetical protein F4810DRAFT_182819 [Camillea tinctor]